MARDSIQALPADLFHLLSQLLADKSDYGTLYSLVVSCKLIANAGAINALYRISHASPVRSGGSENLSLAEQHLNVQKWSILWRSIVLSTLGKTIYPYCRHLRMLDLRDLGHLLEDDKFKGKVSKQFFAGDLSRFHLTRTVPTRTKLEVLDRKKILFAIGDEVTQQSPLLQGLAEPEFDMLSTALLVWPERLAHLQSLEVFDGGVFADETVRNLLHAHCPNLNTIGVYRCQADEGDHALGSLIGGMPENKLIKFETHGDCGIGAETCLALTNHGQSLHELRLFLKEQGILALALLQGCTALSTLVITTDSPPVDLKATQNDVYLEIAEWLKSCTRLQYLSFQNVLSAPDLILPALEEGKVALESLFINAKPDSCYVVKDHHDFHRALSRQNALQNLQLQADADPVSRDDIETLMDTFCALENLRDLRITRISDYFSDGQINLLTQHLPKLQELYIAGYGITDAIWPGMAKLKELKNVTFGGVTAFTSEGIMNFVEELGSGNTGLSLSIDMADTDSGLSQEEQDLLRELIHVRLEGKFEYQLMRDPNMPEFDSEEDSD